MSKKLLTYGEVKTKLQEDFYPETLVDDMHFILEPTPVSKYPACIAIGAKVQHADTVKELIEDIETFYQTDDKLQTPIIDIYEERCFYHGEIVKYFKAEYNTPEDYQFKYYYKIICIGMNTETKEKIIIYQALYDDRKIYAKPYNMFMSRVNKEQYPDIKQKYRFEAINNEIAKNLNDQYMVKVTVNNLMSALSKVKNKEQFIVLSQDPDRYSYLQSVYELDSNEDDTSMVALIATVDNTIVKVTVNNLMSTLSKVKNKEQFIVLSQDPDSYSYLQSVYELTDSNEDDTNVVALIGAEDTPSEYFTPKQIL